MNTIVPFPAMRQDRPPMVGTDTGARILFFTGVRYVRDREPESELTVDVLGVADAGEQDGAVQRAAIRIG